MKRTAATLLIIAFVVWAIVDEIREFRANDVAGFYSSHPERLLYVLAITVLGGIVAVAFYRLSPRSQRQAKLFALGGFALFMTSFLGYMLFRLLPLVFPLAALGIVAFVLGLYTAWMNGAFRRCPHCGKVGSWRYDAAEPAVHEKDEDGVLQKRTQIRICRKCGKMVLDKWSDSEGRTFEKAN
jgi:hypothetical protein